MALVMRSRRLKWAAVWIRDDGVIEIVGVFYSRDAARLSVLLRERIGDD